MSHLHSQGETVAVTYWGRVWVGVIERSSQSGIIHCSELVRRWGIDSETVQADHAVAVPGVSGYLYAMDWELMAVNA